MNLNYFKNNKLNLIIGEKVKEVIATPSSGSITYIFFGADKCKYLLLGCAWRLCYRNKTITSWNEPNKRGGPLINGITELEDKIVEKVDVNKYGDLIVYFKSGHELFIFCDITSSVDFFSYNWEFRLQEKVYEFDKFMKLNIEDYK